MTGSRVGLPPLVCLLIVLAPGCAEQRLSTGPPDPFAMISGIVESPFGVDRRQVTATNTATHRVYRVRTSRDGVFGLLLPAGTYHLGVSVRRGEVIADAPPDVEVASGDAKRGITIVLARRSSA